MKLQGRNISRLNRKYIFHRTFRRHLWVGLFARKGNGRKRSRVRNRGDETEEKQRGKIGGNERKRTSRPAEGRVIVSPSGPQKSVAELEGCLSLIKISHNPFHVHWQSLHPLFHRRPSFQTLLSHSLSHLPVCQAEFLIFNYSMPLLISCAVVFSCLAVFDRESPRADPAGTRTFVFTFATNLPLLFVWTLYSKSCWFDRSLLRIVNC